MNIIYLVLQAQEKTQANFLTSEFDLVQISTGDMLREAVKRKTELGMQVESIMLMEV